LDPPPYSLLYEKAFLYDLGNWVFGHVGVTKINMSYVVSESEKTKGMLTGLWFYVSNTIQSRFCKGLQN